MKKTVKYQTLKLKLLRYTSHNANSIQKSLQETMYVNTRDITKDK